MVSTQEIRAVSDLLQISPEGLQKAITFKVTVHMSIMCTEQQHAVFWATFILKYNRFDVETSLRLTLSTLHMH